MAFNLQEDLLLMSRDWDKHGVPDRGSESDDDFDDDAGDYHHDYEPAERVRDHHRSQRFERRDPALDVSAEFEESFDEDNVDPDAGFVPRNRPHSVRYRKAPVASKSATTNHGSRTANTHGDEAPEQQKNSNPVMVKRTCLCVHVAVVKRWKLLWTIAEGMDCSFWCRPRAVCGHWSVGRKKRNTQSKMYVVIRSFD